MDNSRLLISDYLSSIKKSAATSVLHLKYNYLYLEERTPKVKRVHLVIIFFVLLLSLLLLLRWHGSRKSKDTTDAEYGSGSKWIVITTSSHYPREDIKNLASKPGWSLVVVDDNSTAEDWNIPGSHFLSEDYQRNMDSHLYHNVENVSDIRKMMGYLYAIKNGAEWIFDTDFNLKLYGYALDQFEFKENVRGLRYEPSSLESMEDKFFDPNSFFGYPSSELASYGGKQLKEDQMLLCRTMPLSSIQYGHIYIDRDLARHSERVTDEFNKFTPPIALKTGIFTPWTHANSLFHRSAFFTLMHPTTSMFRIADIWRQYFVQKLLHLTGQSISLYPANAIKRHKPANHDKSMDSRTSLIVEFLDKWKCTKDTMKECVILLAEHSKMYGFITSREVYYLRLWLKDLDGIGYVFPKLVNATDYSSGDKLDANCRRANLHLEDNRNAANNFELAARKLDGFSEVLDWCSAADPTFRDYELPSPSSLANEHSYDVSLWNKSDTALILISPSPWDQSIGLIQRIYSPYFAITIFCGPMNLENLKDDGSFPRVLRPFTFINVNEVDLQKGNLGYYCVSKAREIGLHNLKGYFVMSSDTVFNIWSDSDFTRTLAVREAKEAKKKVESTLWEKINGGDPAATKVVQLVSSKYEKVKEVQEVWTKFTKGLNDNGNTNNAVRHLLAATKKTKSNYYYITDSDMDQVAKLFELFAEAGLTHGEALSKVIDSLNHDRMLDSDLNSDDEEGILAYNASSVFANPIIFGDLTNLAKRKEFCNTVISEFKDQLYEF